MTVESDGVPKSRTFPNNVIKSITSPVAKLLAKVIVEPDTVNEPPGFCKIPLSETSMWLADSGTTFTEFTCIVYAA